MKITGRGAGVGVCIFFAATCASAAELGKNEATNSLTFMGKESALVAAAVIKAKAELLPSLSVCGSKWYQRLGLQILEVEQATRGGYSFNAACKAHDACYTECNSIRTVCDTQLLTDAEAVCESAINRANCLADAQLFYMAVSKKGNDPFRQAQARCESNPSLSNPTSAAVGSSLAQEPFAQLLAAAEGGDPASQLQVGVAYATGDGVRVNGSEAVRWLERAAAANGKNAAVAAGWLGVVHERGMGVRKSGETAVRWYTRGAEIGSGTSAQNLGELYLAGKLVKKNEKLGYEWYARAAKLYEAEAAEGDANAAYQAGRIYHRGMGVSPDPTKAIALYEIASGAGNANATKFLNEIRAQTKGVVAAAPANPAWRRAADPPSGGMFTFRQSCPSSLNELFMASQEGVYQIQIDLPRADFLMVQANLPALLDRALQFAKRICGRELTITKADITVFAPGFESKSVPAATAKYGGGLHEALRSGKSSSIIYRNNVLAKANREALTNSAPFEKIVDVQELTANPFPLQGHSIALYVEFESMETATLAILTSFMSAHGREAAAAFGSRIPRIAVQGTPGTTFTSVGQRAVLAATVVGRTEQPILGERLPLLTFKGIHMCPDAECSDF